MKYRTSIITLVSAVCVSCSVTHHEAWISPDKNAELRFVMGPQGPTHSSEDSFSYYSLHDLRSGERWISVRSIINEYTIDFVQKQRVHFSPSGKTVLIEEDITDASPDYAYTLIYHDGGRYSGRDLALPTRSSSNLEDVYGLWPDVVSITDDAIEIRFRDDEASSWVKLSELRDRGFEGGP